jgi:dolichol kinase
VGKRIGRHRWSATTNKSLEGSAAFVLSIVASAWLLRLLGLTEPFSVRGAGARGCACVPDLNYAPLQIFRYTVVVGLTAAIEALSVQNDNLTIPLFMWSVLRVTVV